MLPLAWHQGNFPSLFWQGWPTEQTKTTESMSLTLSLLPRLPASNSRIGQTPSDPSSTLPSCSQCPVGRTVRWSPQRML